jgi:hypothetical protein
MVRILRPERYLAVYVHDSFEKGKPFMPIGYKLFDQLSRRLTPVDAIAVVRNNRTLLRNHFHQAAADHNYYLRGFGHLLLFYKPSVRNPAPMDRRDPDERRHQVGAFEVEHSSPRPTKEHNPARSAAPMRPEPARRSTGGAKHRRPPR